jgi:hypothetical protein
MIQEKLEGVDNILTKLLYLYRKHTNLCGINIISYAQSFVRETLIYQLKIWS